jgi:hypothetical protein
LCDIVVLLTCTVRVKPSITELKQTSAAEREADYRASINKWLTNTAFKIVVVENSGFNMSPSWLGVDGGVGVDRYEAILFDEARDKDAPHGNTSKGIHELYAINKAFASSKFIAAAPFVVKVTGRFFVPGLQAVMRGLSRDVRALRQSNEDECQVVGCRPEIAPILFNQQADGFVERSYKARLQDVRWTKNKVAVLPPMPIAKTRTGGHGVYIYKL